MKKETTTKTKKVKKVEAAPAQPSKHTVLSGVVERTSMQKTIVVKVNRLVKHPKYQKYMNITKKYKVHDENGVAKVGDKVRIIETRPISKDKHFTLVLEK